MANQTELEEHLAECERKIEKLQSQVNRLEERLEATIRIAAREVEAVVLDRLAAAARRDFTSS